MKQEFDLAAYGAVEMTKDELLKVEGGSIFSKIADTLDRAWDSTCEWVGQAAHDVWEFMTGHDKGAPEGGARFRF